MPKSQTTWWDEYVRTVEKKAGRRRQAAPTDTSHVHRASPVIEREAHTHKPRKKPKRRRAPAHPAPAVTRRAPAPKRPRSQRRPATHKPKRARPRPRLRRAPVAQQFHPQRAPRPVSRPKRATKSVGRRKTAAVMHHPPCVHCGHPQAAHAHDRPHLCAQCQCPGYVMTRRK
jgi:hypothetical protein